MFSRDGFWVRRRQGKIIAIIHADNYKDSRYNFETGKFEPRERPFTELGMSDDWDKEDEEDLLKELGKKKW
ncbi:MAG: hypothetical protein LKE33_08520 [Acidaminococcus sp.]|jgi:hypothetical protein|nr:hypothetical protein [Acidaminococcus sp.]MCI2114443.1 hypothetical protein [Acidaminococcus sp.]MCI2116168.1 hypothetical protein [Acidaminococcus sp.]